MMKKKFIITKADLQEKWKLFMMKKKFITTKASLQEIQEEIFQSENKNKHSKRSQELSEQCQKS